MRDLITSGVKTAVQVAVAALGAWAASLGIDFDSVALEATLFSIATGAVAIALNALAAKWPILNRVLSLGLTTSGPNYTK